MAFDLPQRRVNVRQIQTQKRNIPLEQIMAVESFNPLAQGIETAGNLIGQSLQQRARARQVGEQLAKLETLAGQPQGSFAGLDPSTATAFTQKLIADRATSYNPAQLQALHSGDPSIISQSFPGGVPKEAATLAATIGSREENRMLRKQQFEEVVSSRRSKEKTDIVNKFNSDSGVKKINATIDSAATVRELALSGNPIAAGAIPTYMARASGEVGNLSEADKAPFGGSRAILSRLDAALKQQATGQLSDDNRQFIISLADTMEKRAVDNLDRRANEVSSQYGEASDFLKSNDIYNTLRPPKLKSIDKTPPPPLSPVGYSPDKEKRYQEWKQKHGY